MQTVAIIPSNLNRRLVAHGINTGALKNIRN